jgi:hypothetical protein
MEESCLLHWCILHTCAHLPLCAWRKAGGLLRCAPGQQGQRRRGAAVRSSRRPDANDSVDRGPESKGRTAGRCRTRCRTPQGSRLRSKVAMRSINWNRETSCVGFLLIFFFTLVRCTTHTCFQKIYWALVVEVFYGTQYDLYDQLKKDLYAIEKDLYVRIRRSRLILYDWFF